jgi:hypothetical protein
VALAPAEDEAPLVRATVVKASDFGPESLQGQRVVVLANIDRLTPGTSAAIESFLANAGSVWVAPGGRTDADFWNEQFSRNGNGWLPARLGDFKGDLVRREPVAHPLPRSFSGPVMTLLGQDNDPPLSSAKLFGFWVLEPSTHEPAAAVMARLDTGDPWLVEHPYRRGRVAMIAGPIDAEGGTLAVNPDFVPWVHELVFHLADTGSNSRVVRLGEPIALALDLPPTADVSSLPVTTPSGAIARAIVTHSAGVARLRFDDTSEPGVYRIDLPDRPGSRAYAVVSGDSREDDLAPLEPAEAEHLAQGWPMVFEAQPDQLSGRLFAAGSRGRQEVWRALVLAALAGLCLEVWLTRQVVRGREAPP